MTNDGPCPVRRQLRDAYLIALSMEDSLRRALQSGEATVRELRDAGDHLIDISNRNWMHLERHPLPQPRNNGLRTRRS
jgi:hypothetical protein